MVIIMIEIKDKSLCTGCGGCANVCPVDAITMQLDEEGFLYPYIDMEKCIHCNQCDAVCHMNVGVERSDTDSKVYAACSGNLSVLDTVSSGGVFSVLAEEMLRRGGSVYGVVMDEKHQVYHAKATTLEECMKFRKSKYLESSTNDCFTQVKADLQMDRWVLFSGVGCQVAGLLSFLRNVNRDKLVTCEVVCHGVPSRKVFESYISELEKEKGSKVVRVNYRDKSKGWKPNYISFLFENGEVFCEHSGKNLLHGTYLKGFFSRPSCGGCRYASVPRVADITCADYWRYDGKLLEGNANKGISLVLCNNEKGNEFFRHAAEGNLLVEESTMEKAAASCRHLTHSPKTAAERERFFMLLDKRGYKEAVRLCTQPPLKVRVKYKLKGLKNKLKGK